MKKRMKLISLILCAAILLSAASGVFAAEDSGMTDALMKVKGRIDTSEYDEFRSSYYKDDDGSTTYSFTWSKKEEDATLYLSFRNGIITNYGKYDAQSRSDVDAFSLSAQEAVGIAEEFIARINPQICEDIKPDAPAEQSIQNSTVSIPLYRTFQGIPVLGESGYVTVSKATREVCDYYFNYSEDIRFQPTDGIIGTEEAKRAYQKELPPTLRYKLKRDYDKKEVSAYLEYAPNENGNAISAYDSSSLEAGGGNAGIYNRSMGSAKESAEDAALTPAELEETERVAGLISEDQAIGLLKKNRYVSLSDKYRTERSSLNRDWFYQNVYLYQFDFSDGDRYIGASVDANSGEILSFYRYDDKTENSRQDAEKEKTVAQAAFREFAGEKASEFRLAKEEGTGFLTYVRTANGLDVVGDGASFGFDERDALESYSLRYTRDVSFPSTEVALSPDDAAEVVFSELGFALAYSIDHDKKTAAPVYCVGKNGRMETFTVNPNSGHLTDYQGEDLKGPQTIVYSDIDGHYGKEIFLALSEYGIGFPGGELKPDEAITQAEYIVLLNKAFGYEAGIDEIYKRMIQYGTISAEERADESPLTREKAAILMIREMGAEEYAKYEDIYKPPFDDVSENKGYIALLKAKGIMQGDGSGYFYPRRSVTRGEALIMIYNYCKNYTV